MPAIAYRLGGRIQFYRGGPLVAASHIAAGKLRGIAVTTEKRSTNSMSRNACARPAWWRGHDTPAQFSRFIAKEITKDKKV